MCMLLGEERDARSIGRRAVRNGRGRCDAGGTSLPHACTGAVAEPVQRASVHALIRTHTHTRSPCLGAGTRRRAMASAGERSQRCGPPCLPAAIGCSLEVRKKLFKGIHRGTAEIIHGFRVFLKVARIARMRYLRYDGRLGRAGVGPSVAHPMQRHRCGVSVWLLAVAVTGVACCVWLRCPGCGAGEARRGCPRARTVTCRLCRAVQSTPLNHLCRRTSSAPPRKLPRRFVRSAVRSRFTRSRACASKWAGKAIFPPRIFS